jgi:integrase
MRFSYKNTEGLKLPPKKTEHIFWDSQIAGFGLRVRAGGSRNWIFQYRLGGKQRRISFGSATTVTADQARKKAATLHARVKLGQDPAGEKIEARARATETFGDVLRARVKPGQEPAGYLVRKKAELKPRTYVETERHLLVNAKRLHGLQIASIDRRTVAGLLTEIDAKNGPHAAKHLRAALSAFFSWAMREGLAESNPVIGTNRPVTNGPRDRVLSNHELRSVWAALPDDDDYGAIVKLLALTGQRRDEIGSLRWSEIDFDKAVISLPAERTKNKKPHDVPLSPAALAILKDYHARRTPDREYVFGLGTAGYQGWSKSKEALDRRAAIADWRLHDLRRTVSTRMHDELDIAPHIVEAVLNHISGHRAGVAGTYNRALYSKEKAIALARWAEHLEAIVGGGCSKIIPVSARGRR